MPDVFVSYNSKDQATALELARALQKRDLEVWFDQDRSRIRVGDCLSKALEKGLRDSKVYVILLSESIGPWQALEIEAGIRQYVYQGRPLFPVLLKGANVDMVPMLLGGLVHLDLRDSDSFDDAKIDSLAFAIRSRINKGFDEHVRELHLFERDFLQVLLYDFSLLRSKGGVQLEVRFDHRTPSIATREARRFVRISNPHFKQRAAELEEILQQVYAGERDVLNYQDDDFGFRYASGGTLPILKLGSNEYYCLFLRGIHPIGWNLANGGCNSIEELRDPTKTILRELQEELIVVDSKNWYVFGSQLEDGLDRPEFAVSRDYWNRRFDTLGLRRFEQLRQQSLQIPAPEGPDTLRVKYLNDLPLTHDSLFVSVTSEDYGIEVDRALVLPVEDEGLVLCDGEVNANVSVNRPVGLFRTQGFDPSSAQLTPDFFFYDAQRYDGQDLNRVVADLLIRAMEESVSSLPDYMEDPDSSPPDHIVKEFKAALAEGFGLCPVARRLIRRVAEARRNQ